MNQITRAKARERSNMTTNSLTKTREAEILKFIDDSQYERAEVLIALRMSVQPEQTSRGKLKRTDYIDIIKHIRSGRTNKSLAQQFNVTQSRISEIKNEKSIPANVLKDYLIAKYS